MSGSQRSDKSSSIDIYDDYFFQRKFHLLFQKATLLQDRKIGHFDRMASLGINWKTSAKNGHPRSSRKSKNEPASLEGASKTERAPQEVKFHFIPITLNTWTAPWESDSKNEQGHQSRLLPGFSRTKTFFAILFDEMKVLVLSLGMFKNYRDLFILLYLMRYKDCPKLW